MEILLVISHVLAPVDWAELENTSTSAAGGRSAAADGSRRCRFLSAVVAGDRLASLLKRIRL